MTLDKLAITICTAQGYRREDVRISDLDAARAVLLAVADHLEPRKLRAGRTLDTGLIHRRSTLKDAADELRRIAGEG